MSRQWKFFQKVNLSSYFKALKCVYSDSEGKLLKSDIVGFYGIPILLGVLYFLFVSSEISLQSIYTSIAFLAGFVFSAFIILINLLPKINALQNGPVKAAMQVNTKELALLSILVFLFGLVIVTLSFFDSIISSTNFSYSNYVLQSVRSIAVTTFFVMIVHLIMIAKRLFVILSQ